MQRLKSRVFLLHRTFVQHATCWYQLPVSSTPIFPSPWRLFSLCLEVRVDCLIVTSPHIRRHFVSVTCIYFETLLVAIELGGVVWSSRSSSIIPYVLTSLTGHSNHPSRSTKSHAFPPSGWEAVYCIMYCGVHSRGVEPG